MTLTPSDLDSVLRRLDKLERQNRRLKGIGFALVVCFSVALIAAAQPARDKVGEYEQFVLRDSAGKHRARFEVGRDGPALHFLNEEGRDTATIGMATAGMFLRLNNREGGLQTGVNLNPAGVVVVSYGTTGRLLSGVNAIQEMTGGFTR